MADFFKIVYNEIEKVLLKKNIYAILVAMVVLTCVFATAIKMQLINDGNNFNIYESIIDLSDDDDITDDDKESDSTFSYEYELKLANKKLADFLKEPDVKGTQYEVKLASLNAQIDKLTYKNNKGDEFTKNDWKYYGYNLVSKYEFYDGLRYNSRKSTAVADMYKAVKDDNYSEFMKLITDNIGLIVPDKSMIDAAREVCQFVIDNDIIINQKEDDYKFALINMLIEDKTALFNNEIITESMEYVPLTPEQRVNISDNIALYEYKLLNGVIDPTDNQNFFMMFSSNALTVLIMVVALFIIFLAGTSISGEIQNGTIKTLIIIPFKRWKILSSKIVGYSIIFVLMSLFSYLLVCGVGTAFFGVHNYDYYHIVAGEAIGYNYYWYLFLRTIIGMIEPFMFMMFAFMLSAVSRNSSFSVGVTALTYLVSAGMMEVLSIMGLGFGVGEWVKFIPFSNLDLVSRIFPQSNVISFNIIDVLKDIGINITVTFSLVYILIFTAFITWILFESFCKRDI